MRIKNNFALRRVVDEYIMVFNTGHGYDYTKAIALNDTAAYLIESTGQEEFDAETWARLLSTRYEVDEATALTDVKDLIAKFAEAGALEE